MSTHHISKNLKNLVKPPFSPPLIVLADHVGGLERKAYSGAERGCSSNHKFLHVLFPFFLETRFKVVRGVPESGSGKFSFP